MKIKKSEFELYETCIRSGQVGQSEVFALLAENPEFAAWYEERLTKDDTAAAAHI